MKEHRGDIVVVGSGAGGATIAHRLVEQGHKVVLLEAGGHYKTEDYTTDFWSSMKHLFWDNGFQYAPGRPTVPFLQGRALGGTTVINSAISWDLPEDVHRHWVEQDAFAVDYVDIAAEQQRIRQELHIVTTRPEILGQNSDLMARGAQRLGWAGRPVDRNERSCRGSGRCLVGCPNAAKLSMELSYIPWAQEKGLEVITDCEVEHVIIEKGRVKGVVANQLSRKARQRGLRRVPGERMTIRAAQVVIAAGVIQSPLILQRSRVPDPHRLIGSHLMSHPGVSIVGVFDERVNIWQGATQGYEVTEFRDKGIKLESLGITPALFALRLPHAGVDWAELYEQRAHMTLWAAAVRTASHGSVKLRRLLSPIRYPISPVDTRQFMLALEVLGELMFAAGARCIYPGVQGHPTPVSSQEELLKITRADIRAEQIHPVATHLFGTCRLSDDPKRGVINKNFESHHVKGLYVADGSVFPSNTGVNPQLGIMALAGVAARRIAAPQGR